LLPAESGLSWVQYPNTVDGFLIYHKKELIDLFDLKFFTTASYDALNGRRKQRQSYITNTGDWQDPPNYFEDVVYPSYLKYNKHILEGKVDCDWHTFNSDSKSIEQIVVEAIDVISKFSRE
jgi:uridine kinase